jgi:hypothetical protein
MGTQVRSGATLVRTMLGTTVMENCRVVVTTCNKYAWATRPFAYLFNTYWSPVESVHILCESHITGLPPNFQCRPISLAGEGGWPMQMWSDGVAKYLNTIPEQFVIIMLEDYWLTRQVDTEAIQIALEYMSQYRSILRIDLTTDRLYAGGVKPHDTYKRLDFVNADGSQYEMSLMPGLWNKKLLLDVLQPNMSPWDVELQGTTIVNENAELVVLGTRQNPIRFVNALRNHTTAINVNDVREPLKSEIRKWFPTDREVEDFLWYAYPENKPE